MQGNGIQSRGQSVCIERAIIAVKLIAHLCYGIGERIRRRGADLVDKCLPGFRRGNGKCEIPDSNHTFLKRITCKYIDRIADNAADQDRWRIGSGSGNIEVHFLPVKEINLIVGTVRPVKACSRSIELPDLE